MDGQVEQRLREKAAYLYEVMLRNPARVPLLEPDNEALYPPEIQSPEQEAFWVELVRRLQVCDC